MLTYVVLIVAGLLAGGLNAVAGGGTFLSFPALVWLGVPPIMANATATLTALPGYIGSAWAYRSEVAAEGSLKLASIIAIAAIGGLAGAGLLLVTPGEAFVGIVPWLLLAATVLFAAGPHLLAAVKTRGSGVAGPVVSAVAVFAVSVYGGYFNGGLGIMLLAMLGLIGFTNLHGMNGLKNLLSAILSIVSVATYTVAGLIAWDSALVLAVATTVGGYVGASQARRIRRTDLLRLGIVAVGAVMTVIFFVY
ncbi:membrane protein, putative [Oceanicola granulosus HTCC2516]|uniref:Probable membrane transporter protein n=1 Tax=Oceanicola granulosus (strain ATCC BAA-861 / DSM 15982 / KCTC 12143 / HTCC2516) TaxID=314256 RepID=Q2CK00_OCEGH|nr:sulfite exporter TauE/SafE family protein [Oceanicola granulosus]EAR52989.1 membrane protein, putative [Oceanicola granulosus HTCC2516]